MIPARLHVAVLILVALGACGGGEGRSDGELGGTCYPNGTCNAGLTCLGTTCSREIDAGIDAPHDGTTDAPPDAPLDAYVPPDAYAGFCNVLTQAGCAAQACGWVVDQAVPSYLGHITCVGPGTVQAGQACTHNGGNNTGVDNCAAGLVCYGNVCRTICDLGGGAPACSGLTCRSHSGLLTGASGPVAGICEP